MIFLWIWSVLSRIKLPINIPSILIKNRDHIIFPGLSVLFLYALARGVQLSLKIIFELESFLYSFRMGFSLAKQLILPKKIVAIRKVHYFDFLVSFQYTFNSMSLLIYWSKTLEGVHDGQQRNMKSGQPCQAIKGSERRPFIYINFRLNIVLSHFHHLRPPTYHSFPPPPPASQIQSMKF